MKSIKHFLIFVILLFQHTTSNADVLEIGGGLTESYNGEFPLWSDSSVKMKSIGMPITISLMFNNLRIGYIDYKQYARDFHSTVSTYAKVENNILSFNYFGDIIANESLSLNYFGGLGFYRSYYELNLNKISSDDYAINVIGNSSNSIDPGIIAGLSLHQYFDKGFLGINFTYIPSKKINYEYSWVSDKYYLTNEWNELEEIDIGGNIVFLVTGTKF